VPETTEDWLELQALFDLAGDKLGRAAAAYNDVSYQVKVIAGVRAYSGQSDHPFRLIPIT
jgi:hypothetical protein